MPRLAALVALLAFLGLSCWIAAGSSYAQERGGVGEGEGLKLPLDLPSGGQGDDEDDEDLPESITFYGSEYEGDAFFWCLDKSCSMGWAGGAPLATLKQEMTSAIHELSNRAELGIVAFNTGYSVWAPTPQRATPSAKSSAISWVQSMVAGGTTCIAPPAIQTINIANMSAKRNRSMILVGDGVPECPPPYTPEQGDQVLNDVTAANYQRIPIHTIFISASEAGVAFMQQLAAMNNGTFTHVQ